MEFTFLSNLVIGYLVFAFAKFALCIPHIPRVIGVMSRLSGAKRGTVKTWYVFAIPVLIAGTALIRWVPSLLGEGFRFFVVYPTFMVMRDCVSAYRASHPED